MHAHIHTHTHAHTHMYMINHAAAGVLSIGFAELDNRRELCPTGQQDCFFQVLLPRVASAPPVAANERVTCVYLNHTAAGPNVVFVPEPDLGQADATLTSGGLAWWQAGQGRVLGKETVKGKKLERGAKGIEQKGEVDKGFCGR